MAKPLIKRQASPRPLHSTCLQPCSLLDRNSRATDRPSRSQEKSPSAKTQTQSFPRCVLSFANFCKSFEPWQLFASSGSCPRANGDQARGRWCRSGYYSLAKIAFLHAPSGLNSSRNSQRTDLYRDLALIALRAECSTLFTSHYADSSCYCQLTDFPPTLG